ncbi:flagellar M-ring protein FliF [Burkholderia plantarii]|uniref:flagellar basal-body MS-ring/collar protein FliF n=1 Tax=Burkholderia plantarii TaxID=41899 RepID=UPI00272CBEE3|nr:flagellar basal-body MS-ring/collar protein FliF [Burkholderia plantarii]WLE58880.1 flagellar M-ring protein FliF [Burkholderia plantarii]
MDSPLSRFRRAFGDASPGRQLAGVAVVVLIVAALSVAAYLMLRPRYQVLFRNLKPQDSATIVAELERQKVPFRVDEASAAVLVPEADAAVTRLKLMSGDLRLQGTVGFELFNNADLGLTDFAQKVNYQRALQGELARTIMSLDEIELARVHLALPDSSLFRRADDRPKASVALFMRHGQTLTPDTVHGIQRLVAAAVPQLSAADVTVVDQRGEPATSRDAPIDDPHFALKRAIEREYERKIDTQIAPLLGARHATVSVDATLDFDQVRVTSESELRRPLAGSADAGTPLPAVPAAHGAAALVGPPPLPVQAAGDGSRTEHRVEQIVSAPGSLKHLSVAVVLDEALPAETLAQLKSVAATAVGIDAARGDTVVVVARTEAAASTATPLAVPPASLAPPPAAGTVRERPAATAPRGASGEVARALGALGAPATVPAVVVLAIVLLTGAAWGWRRLARGPRRAGVRAMTPPERDEYVTRLRALLSETRQHHEN